MKTYHVYIMTNRSGTLYTGVTGNLKRRVYEHKHKLVPGFSQRYNIDRLVWFEETGDVQSAIAMEKKIKGWRRDKKVAAMVPRHKAPLGRQSVRDGVLRCRSTREPLTFMR